VVRSVPVCYPNLPVVLTEKQIFEQYIDPIPD
jgi:hypothetical protein